MARVRVDLSGQVAFITGAGSGIGRGVALQWAVAGAGVAVADANTLAAAEVAQEITARGGRALSLAVDVREPDQIAAAVEQTTAALGPIDLVLANAGVLGPADYLETSPADWDFVLDVNVKGVAMTCRAVVPQMIERRRGRILITASPNGMRAAAHVIPYRVSKAAILMFTRCLALALAPNGITVNAICPGVTLTPMQLAYAQEAAASRHIDLDTYLQDRAARIPMHEFTTVDDIAALAEFLASDGARLITGQAIAADGGMGVG